MYRTHNTARHCPALHCTALHYTALNVIERHGPDLNGTTLYLKLQSSQSSNLVQELLRTILSPLV